LCATMQSCQFIAGVKHGTSFVCRLRPSSNSNGAEAATRGSVAMLW
jgi:hypothetical protein